MDCMSREEFASLKQGDIVHYRSDHSCRSLRGAKGRYDSPYSIDYGWFNLLDGATWMSKSQVHSPRECLTPGIIRNDGAYSTSVESSNNDLFSIMMAESREKTRKEDLARPKDSPRKWL